MTSEVLFLRESRVPLPLGIGSHLEGSASKGAVRVRTARIDGQRVANPHVTVKNGEVSVETKTGQKRTLKGSEINQAELVVDDGRSPLRRVFSFTGNQRLVSSY